MSNKSAAISGVARPGRKAPWWDTIMGGVPYLFGFLILFVLWHIAATYLMKSVLFPPPLAVLKAAVQMIRDGSLLTAISASLMRIVTGFVCGVALGVPIGLAIGNFSLVRKLLEPWTEFFRFVPPTAMITVAVIWFGIGEGSKVFLIIYATIFIVILSTAAGVSSIAPNKVRAAQTLGASPRQIFIYVSLPATMPFILTGMRLAMANSFMTVVAAEMVAAQEGLGVMIWTGRLFMLVDQIFTALLALGLLGFAADRLFRYGIFKFAGQYEPVA